MKINAIFSLILLFMVGCTHTAQKRAPEIVASCFSDGEDQTHVCKSQRTLDDGRTAVTRCIGAQNRIAIAAYRGKCVEKICSGASNTDCETHGEFAVLGIYDQLQRNRLFAEDEMAPAAGTSTAPAKKSKEKRKGKGRNAMLRAAPAEPDIDVDPSVRLPPEPVKEEPVAAAPAPAPKAVAQEPAEPPQMSVILKPAKSAPAVASKRARDPASVKAAPLTEGFKRVCISKNDLSAPQILRGKCATRSCASGKCNYKGRKEMFDWAAR